MESKITKVVVLHFCIILFYSWLGCNGQFSDYKFSKSPSGYVGLQAEAFLNGQLNLTIKPSPELLKLNDPYDPKLNEAYRLHDASLFNGKYFLYFSPVISLLIVCPIYFVTNSYISQKAIALLVSILIYFLIYLIVKNLAKNRVKINDATVVMASGLTSCIPYVLGRIEIYETIILGAIATQLVAVLLLIKSRQNPNFVDLLLIGIFSSLTFLQRPNLVFSCFFLLLASLLIHKRYLLNKSRPKRILHSAALVTPSFVGIIMIFWYNFARFKNPLEFGTSYQLMGLDQRGWKFLEIKNFVPQLLGNLLNPYRLSSSFPYFHVSPRFPSPILENSVPSEHFSGIFALPISIMTLNLLYSRVRRSVFRGEDGRFLGVCLFLGIFNLTISSLGPGTTSRYTVEFIPYFTIVNLVLFTQLPIIKRRGISLITNSQKLANFLLIFSILIVILSSFEGYGSLLSARSPNQYRVLTNIFP